jgi:hypothetical protein
VCSYDNWRTTSDELLATLGPHERELINSQVAQETYGI